MWLIKEMTTQVIAVTTEAFSQVLQHNETASKT
jgi:heme/copper-type cytochrome/quinol oxidase subunit 2